MSGATVAIRARGDAATLDIARAANGIVRAAVDRAGGHVIKSLGEGLLLAFPPERAPDAVRELEAARDEATAIWRRFDAGCEFHITATVGPVLIGDLGLALDGATDVWGLTVHGLFKARPNGFVLLPDLKALLDAPPSAV